VETAKRGKSYSTMISILEKDSLRLKDAGLDDAARGRGGASKRKGEQMLFIIHNFHK
jgi:hypothetical protein